ncbi:MAG: HD domain-containing phosphohydrolase [Planctomycetota bacterium]
MHPLNPTMESPMPMSIAIPNTTDESLQSHWFKKYSELLETSTIAIVDDEQLNIEVVQGYLVQEGYRNFVRTTDATKAMTMISETNPDVVLLDIMMPEISGLEILTAMRTDAKLCHIPVIVLTACTSADVKLSALQLGPSDFLSKPVDASELILRIRNVLAVKAYQDQLADYSQELERRVEERTREVVESRQRIIHCLARAAEYRDDDTGKHVMRVGKYAKLIALELGFNERQADLIEQAAQLHDIGKIGVPDSVLLKEGKLSPDEFDVIKTHCEIGDTIINPLNPDEFKAYQKHSEVGAELLEMDGYPVLQLAGVIAQTHHEKWDGSGYPFGLKGEEIPIEGRITAVADVFDALSSARPYKPAFELKKCLEIMLSNQGTHFDPRVFQAFLNRLEEIVAVQQQLTD